MTNGPEHTIRIPVGMMLHMKHALMIARNAALMCREPEAQKWFEEQKDLLSEILPKEALFFDDEDWRKICERVVGGHDIKFTVHKIRWKESYVVVVTDETSPLGTWGFLGGYTPKEFNNEEAWDIKIKLESFFASL